MKLKLILLTILSSFICTLSANENAKELFIQKCSTCHFEKVPADKSTVVAPPAPGLMFHMSELFSTNKQIKNHMMDFVINPTQ